MQECLKMLLVVACVNARGAPKKLFILAGPPLSRSFCLGRSCMRRYKILQYISMRFASTLVVLPNLSTRRPRGDGRAVLPCMEVETRQLGRRLTLQTSQLAMALKPMPRPDRAMG